MIKLNGVKPPTGERQYFDVGLAECKPTLCRRVLEPGERADRERLLLEFVFSHQQIKGRPPTFSAIERETQIPASTACALWREIGE